MDAALNILLVEDSPTDVLLAQDALDNRKHFDLTVIDRLTTALDLLEERSFDIVLLDLGLPDSQGLDTLRRLRQRNPSVPVIVMTAHDDDVLALKAVQEGSQDYLVKSRLEGEILARSIRYAIERNVATQALQEREELFRGAFENTAVGMVLTDPENRFLRVNESFARMFGYAPTEMVGMRMAEVTHPDDIAESLAKRDRLLAGEDTFFQHEKRYRHRDGFLFWGLTNVSLIRDTVGKPLNYVGQVRDITEKKQAGEERDRLFSESLSLLGLLGVDGRFQRLNPAWERTLGYTTEELLTEPFMTFVHPDDNDAALAQMGRLGSGAKMLSFESRLRCKDGIYRTFLWSGTPLLDQGCFSVSGHDITEKKWADEALRLRERAMQAVSQGIVITDANEPDNPIVYANPSFLQLTGYESGEVIGRNCRFLQGEGSDKAAVARIREAIRDGRFCKEELRNYRKDGTPFWNELSIAPVKDDNGKLTHFVGVQTDVTQRRSLEDQLRQAQKMEAFGQLAGGVAHDFNNLLTIISGYSEIISSTAKLDDPTRDLVKNISEAGERAASLTRQLLAFSRKTVLDPKMLDLNEVVQDTGKMLQRLIGEDILFTKVLDPTISRVKVDPDQLGHVLMNLSVNARDAMLNGGRITVETRNVELDEVYACFKADVVPGKYVLLSVADTGSGMTEEVKTRIFEPFFTTKGVGKGTGLGLAVVMGIIKQSGGHVAVYSELDRGTTFKLYFPAVDEQAVDAKGLLHHGDVRGTETVLLVEDEDGVRGLALLVLEMNGYKVLEARDGKDAMRVVANHQGSIDLLLTDVVMPGMGGREVAETLQPRFPQMKVLYTSGYTDDAIVRHGVLRAESSFLQKPYSPQSLAKKVRQVLENK